MKREKKRKKRFLCIEYSCGHQIPVAEIKGNIYQYLKIVKGVKSEILKKMTENTDNSLIL